MHTTSLSREARPTADVERLDILDALRGLALAGIFLHLYIWEGDILFLYALVGFLLIPFRRVRDATLVRAAVALVLAPVALEALIVVSSAWATRCCR